MSDLYTGLPANYGGFDPSQIVGGSGSAGYYQKSMGLPYYQGRGILATIPEYERNPLLMEKDMITRIREGRLAMMKSLYSYAEANGALTVNDVRFRLPIDIEPNQRFYVKPGTSIAAGATTVITVDSNNTPVKTAHPDGNIKQKGDIARLEVGQFIMLMFFWTDPRRTLRPRVSSVPISSHPVPEICKITAIDYDRSKITVERNWAGAQRTTTPTAPIALSIVANSATAVAGTSLNAKHAYFVAMAKSMKEDEIDAKISNYSGTWTSGNLQRHLKAWGQQYLAEVIAKNMGLPSKGAQTKRIAIEDYYRHWEWTSIFGEKNEEWDPATGFWSGTTDGILTNIPKEHYVAIRGIDWGQIGGSSSGLYTGFGSFNPLIFNKMLENYGYIGSEEKILLCGSGFHTAFSTMINNMTQNVPDIKSEWKVEGKRFTTSNGLKIDVIPSDLFSLNGFKQTAILMDKKYFRLVKLNNYSTDMFDLQNENPLIKNGFIHGMQGFIDLNPDAHWVFTVIEKSAYADGNSYASGATWGSSGLSNLGTYLS